MTRPARRDSPYQATKRTRAPPLCPFPSAIRPLIPTCLCVCPGVLVQSRSKFPTFQTPFPSWSSWSTRRAPTAPSWHQGPQVLLRPHVWMTQIGSHCALMRRGATPGATARLLQQLQSPLPGHLPSYWSYSRSHLGDSSGNSSSYSSDERSISPDERQLLPPPATTGAYWRLLGPDLPLLPRPRKVLQAGPRLMARLLHPLWARPSHGPPRTLG